MAPFLRVWSKGRDEDGNGKHGIFSIEEQELVLAVDYDYVSRWGDWNCVVKKEGKHGTFSMTTYEITWN